MLHIDALKNVTEPVQPADMCVGGIYVPTGHINEVYLLWLAVALEVLEQQTHTVGLTFSFFKHTHTHIHGQKTQKAESLQQPGCTGLYQTTTHSHLWGHTAVCFLVLVHQMASRKARFICHNYLVSLMRLTSG